MSVDEFRAASAVTACEAGAYQWDAALLGPLCPLMGRKFTAATAEAVFTLLWQVRSNTVNLTANQIGSFLMAVEKPVTPQKIKKLNHQLRRASD